MKNLSYILTLINMVIMVILIIMISLQNKTSGLSSVFGGGGVVQTRRGADKWLFYATITFGVLFVSLTIATLFLKK